jgi:hypothetical protein
MLRGPRENSGVVKVCAAGAAADGADYEGAAAVGGVVPAEQGAAGVACKGLHDFEVYSFQSISFNKQKHK